MLCIPEAAFRLKSIKLCSALTGVKLFMNQGHSSLLPSNNPAIQGGLHLTSTLSGDVCLNVCVCVKCVCVYICIYIYIYTYMLGFPVGSDGKESSCNEGDLGLNPGWENLKHSQLIS